MTLTSAEVIDVMEAAAKQRQQTIIRWLIDRKLRLMLGLENLLTLLLKLSKSISFVRYMIKNLRVRVLIFYLLRILALMR